MTELLPTMEGEARSRELSQWFTPPELAVHLVEWSSVGRDWALPVSVLEPSAGRGALVRAIDALLPVKRLVAFEIDPEHRAHLASQHFPSEPCPCHMVGSDFMAWTPDGRFDLAVMNPPYERNQDVAFIERALGCSDRVVGIFQSRIVHSKGRAEFWRHTDIQRMAILTERPRFGGGYSPMTDFVVLELVRRQHARQQGEATPTLTEWW